MALLLHTSVEMILLPKDLIDSGAFAEDANKGKGSYSAALAAFATNIAERQESLIRTMMEEARKTATQEARRQQEYERKLMMEHTTLLTTQLRKIITENTQATLQGIKLLMDVNQQMGIANMHTAITETAGGSTFVSAPPGQPVVPAAVITQACLGQEMLTSAGDLDTPVPAFECVVDKSSSAPYLYVLDRPESFKETTE